MNEADFQVICKSMPYLKTLDLSEINNTVLPDKCFYESSEAVIAGLQPGIRKSQ